MLAVLTIVFGMIIPSICIFLSYTAEDNSSRLRVVKVKTKNGYARRVSR